MHPRRLAFAAALLVITLTLAVPAVADEQAGWQSRIDAIADPAMSALVRAQRADGTFTDSTKGSIGANGLTKAAWVAARQASRMDADDRSARVTLAQLTLSRGLGGNQVLDKWALALLADDEDAGQVPQIRGLDDALRHLGRLHAPGVADACFQRPGCFNNYSLTSRVLDLELARSGLRSSVPGSRLHDPGLRMRALRWLRDVLPRTSTRTGRVLVPGVGIRSAAALSDPHRYPLAYQAFCTAMLTRAVAIGGEHTPAGVRRLLQASLWELVGMTAPDGEVSWLGRGQDEVWTLGAAFYAAMQGSILVADRDPALAARLRRLADVELGALSGRLTATGLAQTPSARAGRAGVDHYASAVGNAALALVWMELAREIAPQVRGTVRPLPSESPGARSSDPRGNGLLTLRRGDVWLGVHRRRDHLLDARQDFGLLRAMRRGPDGRWQALLPERPIIRPGAHSPAGGPLLLRGGHLSSPVVTSGGVTGSAIRLSGGWQGSGVRGRWTYRPAGTGVQLITTCPAGSTLEFTAWLPRAGELTQTASAVSRGGYTVAFSRAIRAYGLPTRYGSAREPDLQAMRVRVACSGAPLTVTWTGSAIAAG